MKNVTESVQFKRWFGNWVENPEKASKIVNADGSPEILKLYVEEMYNPNESKTSKRAYKLNYIEQQQPSVGGSSNNVTLASSQATAANVHTVSDLFALVKRCDKKFSPKAASQIVNEDGSPIAPVVIDGYAKQNNVLLDSNAVTSIHGRNNAVTKLLANALNDYTNGQNTLFYWNKKQAIALLQKARVVMPKDSAQARDGYIVSVRDAGSPVKPKMKNVTESAQFKRWFGN